MRARLIPLVVSLAIASSALAAPTPCERTIVSTLRRCVGETQRAQRACYGETGAACPSDHPAIGRALARIDGRLGGVCRDTDVRSLGFGSVATVTGVADRLEDECTAETASLAARTFGGPHAAVLAAGDDTTKTCLDSAFATAAKAIQQSLQLQSSCVKRGRRNTSLCDSAKLAAKIASLRDDAITSIGASCPALFDKIGLDAAGYMDRGLAQSRCLVANALPDHSPLALDCGPRDALPVPPRGQWVQVVLDNQTWGTQCGDGSSYAFWMRLAPVGSPLERVIVDLQGGGVCIFESDCATRDPDLFEATSDYQPAGPTQGWLSTSASVNPFHDWTMLAMPYCTQDVYVGSGGTSTFPSITVQRYGATDTRAALRYLRDVLWPALNEASASGYSPSQLRVLFGGESAGAFGVQYNYHYLLDDLQWIHSTAVPDSALALDNGQLLGVSSLGLLLSAESGIYGWKAKRTLPPYCQGGTCGLGPVLQSASVPRLKRVPEQMFLNVSNQVDTTQVGTTFFPNLPSWITALRSAYCANQGKTGLHYWMPALNTPIHTFMQSNSRYTTIAADGLTLQNFLADAVADPDGVVDRVDEGTLASDYGIAPFACLP